MTLRSFLKAIGLSAFLPVPKVLFDGKAKEPGSISIQERRIETHWFITTNILLRSKDADGANLYEHNNRLDFAAIVAESLLFESGSTEIKRLTFESEPFPFMTQTNYPTIYRNIVNEFLAKVDLHTKERPEDFVPLHHYPKKVFIAVPEML